MTDETKRLEKPKPGFINKEGDITLSFSFLVKHEDLTFGELLGEGGFGKVYKGELDFNPVAIKTFTVHDFTEKTQKAIRREASVMARLSTQSAYLVKLQGLVLGSPQYALVMEYMPGGDLYQLLHSDHDIPWSVRYQIGRDICAGLHHLHKHDVLHCDLKSLNILLNLHYRAKLADFGLTTLKSTSATSTKGVKGTVSWSAPEVLSGEDHSKGSDIYSLGMVLWEMASRQIPYAKAGKLTITMAWIMAGRKEVIPADCPGELKTLIHACWHEKPAERPTAGELAKRLDALGKQRVLDEKKEKLPGGEPLSPLYDMDSGKPLPSPVTPEKQDAEKPAPVPPRPLIYDLGSGKPLNRPEVGGETGPLPPRPLLYGLGSGKPVVPPLALVEREGLRYELNSGQALPPVVEAPTSSSKTADALPSPAPQGHRPPTALDSGVPLPPFSQRRRRKKKYQKLFQLLR